MLQADTLDQGVRWLDLLQGAYSTIPAAALLALVWPLTGWLEARAVRLAVLFSFVIIGQFLNTRKQTSRLRSH